MSPTKDQSDIEMSRAEKIELMSRDVQEILEKVPPWLVRWAITLLSIVLAIVFVGSLYLKYPDVINSSAIILSQNPPAYVVSRTNGHIDYLPIKNGGTVKSGDILAVLKSEARYVDIFKVKDEITNNNFALTNSEGQVTELFQGSLMLGPIQPAFSDFYKQHGEYVMFRRIDLIGKKIGSLYQLVSELKIHSLHLKEQVRIGQRLLELSRAQFTRDSLLYVGKVQSELEFQKSEQELLRVESDYQNRLSQLNSNELEVSKLRHQLSELEYQRREQEQRLIVGLNDAFDNLRSAIAQWERQYVLRAPIDGIVTFTKYWSEKQHVLMNDIVFNVVPDHAQRITIRIKVPISGSGKVLIGQKVLIRLDNYPHTEFGQLEGRIESISLVPQKDDSGVFYLAESGMPNQLVTNYGSVIPFGQELQGQAIIVTNQLSVFDRVVNPIKALLKAND